MRAKALTVPGIVLITAIALLAPVSGTANPAPPTDDPVTRASMDYLITKYGVTEAEARRRLDLQDRLDDLVKPVRDAVGDELHNVWIDQAGGGKLRMLTSRPAQARAALGANADVLVEASRYTSSQLRAAETEVRHRLAGVAGVEIGADPANQQVSVHYGGADRAVSAKVNAAGSRAGQGVPVAVDTTPGTTGQQRACSILSCDPPMRGGVRLHVRRDDGSWGSCTSGFNIRGSNGWVYVLTAGHCVLGANKDKRQYLFHNGLPVVWELHASGSNTDPNSPPDLRYVRNDYPNLDYAILPYQLQPNGRGWHRYWIDDRYGHNRVQSSCVTPSNQACTNGAFSIGSMVRWSDITQGTVVCATGTGTAAVYPENYGYRAGTRCGTIATKYMVTYSSASTAGRGIKVDICSRPGDSGGPLFDRSGRAYGILSGGPARTGACNLSDPLDYSVYSSLELNLRDVSSRTGITMAPITTTSG